MRNKKTRDYVAYRGDDFVDIGSAKELSERLNVPVKTIYWHACCTRHQQLEHFKSTIVFYKVEEDDDE